ncbi:transcriptional regulator, GntR family [Rhizobiales bacterium GAS191]|nr:transcriptional regulator, GntR family [Rhizobiales bacterium GAS191]
MDFQVDRQLLVPIRQQLKGMIEYGIACGELVAGETLPSVRELAMRIGVAPMTVSQVYRELKNQGLIETRPGSGTLVADSSQARLATRSGALALHRRIDAVIDEAMAMGIRGSDLASLINARLLSRTSRGRRVSVVMIGLFPEATASYARFIAARVGEGATVEPMTIGAIQRDSSVRARAGSADLAITLVNRHREVASILPNTKVISIRFIPSEETRRALASIEPMARVAVVSRFADFLPIIRAGVQRFASHVPQINAGNIDDDNIQRLLESSDVVVFATGAEAILSHLKPGITAIEYRHTPDPADIEHVVIPELRGLAQTTVIEERETS